GALAHGRAAAPRLRARPRRALPRGRPRLRSCARCAPPPPASSPRRADGLRAAARRDGHVARLRPSRSAELVRTAAARRPRRPLVDMGLRRCLPERVPVLLVTGPIGVGKTAVLHEADSLLVEAGVRHATVELEELGRCWPDTLESSRTAFVYNNLATLWSNFAA